MPTPYPFHYKVAFHLLRQDGDNNLEIGEFSKNFHIENDPWKAREEAFTAFNDYLGFLEENGNLARDEKENLKIISPSGVPTDLSFLNEKNDETWKTKWRDYFKYKQSIEVLLVIDDKELVEELGHGESMHPLHRVSSGSVNAQSLIDNLEMIELALYRHFNIDTSMAGIVYHYGEDYEESGEEEDGASREILPTPFVWTTKAEYEKIMEVNYVGEEVPVWPQELTIQDLISGGETKTVEFKPSLIHNFKPEFSNFTPQNNNMKTICGFLNSSGGKLLIGLRDDGTCRGIEPDYELLKTKDGIRKKVDELLYFNFGNSIIPLISLSFELVEGNEIIVISVSPSAKPVFRHRRGPDGEVVSKHFYIRRNASTSEMKEVEEIIDYVFHQWVSP